MGRERRSKRQLTRNKVVANPGSAAAPPAAAASSASNQEQTRQELELDGLQEGLALDDWGSAWEQCKREGKGWGGRGRGGRGIQVVSGEALDIDVNGVTLAYDGRVLLNNTKLTVNHGHIYGLIGANGVGKSTLLRRIARGSIPGFPTYLRTLYVEQEGKIDDHAQVLQSVLDAKADFDGRVPLLAMQKKLEAILEAGLGEEGDDDGRSGGDDSPEVDEPERSKRKGFNGVDMAEAAERLGEVCEALEVMDFDSDTGAALDILLSLGFTEEMLFMPCNALSGGWRQKQRLARALFVEPDVLLLDEPTNHFDIEAVLWLEDYLQKQHEDESKNVTAIIVSHDSDFLDAVATDIIKFDHRELQLVYYAGMNYSGYKEAEAETLRHHGNVLDAANRQAAKAHAFIAKQQQQSQTNKKCADPNKQRQAKMKQAKMERIGMFRDDGKRYQLFSLKSLDEASVRLPSKVDAASLRGDRAIQFNIPQPVTAMGGGVGTSASADNSDIFLKPIFTMERCSFRYGDMQADVLTDVTLQLTAKSRVAIMGPNGSGKSTLLKILVDQLYSQPQPWRLPQLRTAYISQHHIVNMAGHLRESAVQYLMTCFGIETELEARKQLGSFGLTGDLALLPIALLSEGQKARVAFAGECAKKPHLIVLDEPTNHLCADSVFALSEGIKQFEGAVVVVSHNQGFVSAFCEELWILRSVTGERIGGSSLNGLAVGGGKAGRGAARGGAKGGAGAKNRRGKGGASIAMMAYRADDAAARDGATGATVDILHDDDGTTFQEKFELYKQYVAQGKRGRKRANAKLKLKLLTGDAAEGETEAY